MKKALALTSIIRRHIIYQDKKDKLFRDLDRLRATLKKELDIFLKDFFDYETTLYLGIESLKNEFKFIYFLKKVAVWIILQIKVQKYDGVCVSPLLMSFYEKLRLKYKEKWT